MDSDAKQQIEFRNEIIGILNTSIITEITHSNENDIVILSIKLKTDISE